jgi:hypothetical protein
MKHLKPVIGDANYWTFFALFLYLAWGALAFIEPKTSPLNLAWAAIGVDQRALSIMYGTTAGLMIPVYGWRGSTRLAVALALIPACLVNVFIAVQSWFNSTVSGINGVNAFFIIVLFILATYALSQMDGCQDYNIVLKKRIQELEADLEKAKVTGADNAGN